MPDKEYTAADFLRQREARTPSGGQRVTPVGQRQPTPESQAAGGFFADSLPAIDFKAELNEQQYAAVASKPGAALVLAGAGSGKTRTLTYRVAWLLHQGVKPWEILLLTFTNKAAKEMLGRVEELTGVPGFRFWGGTFHSIGQKILRRHGTSVGLDTSYNILDQNDAEALLGDVMRERNPAFAREKDHPKPKVIAEILSYARNVMTPVPDVIRERFPWFDTLIDPICEFADAYKKAKLAQKVADFDDLLELWLELLQKDPLVAEEYQRRFRHILVDEYQDTNTLQSAIVDILAAKHHQVMAVGDDAQCIYTWRGARFENIMTFPERHPGATLYKIETNYRSSPEILTFANDILVHQAEGQGYDKTLRAARQSHQRPYFVPAIDAQNEARLVVRRIQILLGNEEYRPRDIAVLYRSHYQSVALQKELFMQAVPYTITSGVRFFEKAHIKDMVALLRFMANPDDTTAFQRFAELLPKVGTKTAVRLREQAQKTADKTGLSLPSALGEDDVVNKVPANAREDWRQLAMTLRDAEEAMGALPSSPRQVQGDLFSAPLEKTPPTNEYTTPAAPEELVQILVDGWYGDYLRNIHANWTERREDLDGLIAFAAEYDTLPDFLAQLTLLTSETADRNLDNDSEVIRLTTIHQAKGLEFPVVFVIGLADGQFPLKRAIEEGDVEEERRLFYVACTRAMDELYLFYPRISFGKGPPTENPPSRFMQEMNPAKYEPIRPTPGY